MRKPLPTHPARRPVGAVAASHTDGDAVTNDPSPTPRARPSRALKARILESQDHACLGCGSRLEAVEFDHVIPLALLGLNHPDNWAALCPPCHREKTRQDLKRIAKAKRQRRFHLLGKGRAPGKGRGFSRGHRRHLDGTVIEVTVTADGDMVAADSGTTRGNGTNKRPVS